VKILHITPHMGGGVGTVIMGWIQKDKAHSHRVISLDVVNEKAWNSGLTFIHGVQREWFSVFESDIVVLHFWDHTMLYDLLDKPFPECRVVAWAHKNYPVPQRYLDYPDLFIDTSPIQGHGRHIWSTGGISRFLEIKPKAHKGFNIGYVGEISYKGKMHPDIFDMCNAIDIPDVHFTFVGENKTAMTSGDKFTFTGKVDDVAPYLAEMDVFGYPLRPDHYGTCEQVIGEAMAAGVVPVLLGNPAEREIGFWVTDVGQYVLQIEYLYKHSELILRETYGKRARERAREIYSIDNMVSEWNKVFDEMMQKPKRSHG